jgi:hypothetical protein
MLDILQWRVDPDEFNQLRMCQTRPPADCHAAFTVKGSRSIWPVATWGGAPSEERVNVRGWFPLLDKIADELLIWQPRGGCFFVSREGVRYRLDPSDGRSVLFLQFEVDHRVVVAPQAVAARPVVWAQ